MDKSSIEYSKWKKRYEIQNKQHRKNLIVRTTLFFGGIILVSVFIYYWSIGSFQFIGKETKEVEAKNVIIKNFHIGKGRYIPRVTIDFEHNFNIYTTYQNIYDSHKHKPIDGGDTVYVSAFVTYDIENPKNCKVRLVYN